MLRFLDTRLEEMLGALLLAVMVTIAFVNVVVRYCTPFSFAWTEELTINFFVWLEVRDEYELEVISEALAVPVWWYTIATPLFSVLTIFRMLQRACADLRSGSY